MPTIIKIWIWTHSSDYSPGTATPKWGVLVGVAKNSFNSQPFSYCDAVAKHEAVPLPIFIVFDLANERSRPNTLAADPRSKWRNIPSKRYIVNVPFLELFLVSPWSIVSNSDERVTLILRDVVQIDPVHDW